MHFPMTWVDGLGRVMPGSAYRNWSEKEVGGIFLLFLPGQIPRRVDWLDERTKRGGGEVKSNR